MDTLKIMEQLDRIEKMIRAGKTVMSLEEASEYTGISRSYLYKLTAKGEIPFSKPRGKMIYFSKDKLDQWLLSDARKSKSELKSEALDYTFRNRKFV
ncbi:helix-turn-helix domain-containing protein [Gillisia limnaea]|uniref:DNA binding domain protein, excisionase family n=1 Tax=Gillisia limnaea (strain DSM 15749 / LMG 21470 / R-8282) TaxID=865937 RepID=H2BW66_GILLR|nr:helix-turn-helix domain-containing protein [Gillisia limnaea]EHQ04030.1 DNA binding domain protein, excisionase family [Gillisia limnaea DSM 15749]